METATVVIGPTEVYCNRKGALLKYILDIIITDLFPLKKNCLNMYQSESKPHKKYDFFPIKNQI